MKKSAFHHRSSNVLRKLRMGYNKRFKIFNQFDSLICEFCNHNCYKLVLSVYLYYKELLELFYRIQLPKVLDFHHILSKFSYLADFMMKLKNCQLTSEETAKNIEQIKDDIQNFKSWKEAITPTIDNPIPRYKKRLKMKWPHKLRLLKKHRR